LELAGLCSGDLHFNTTFSPRSSWALGRWISMKYVKGIISFVTLVFRGFERKHLSLVAAGLAYYFVMSLVPALVLLTAVMAYLPLHNATEGANSFMAHVVPRQGLSLIEPLLATISPHRTGLLSFGIIATLWLTSKAVKGIIAGLDIVYEVSAPRALWINRILAFGLTFAVGVLLLLAVALTLLGPALEALFSAATPVQSLWVRVWPYVQWLLAAFFTFAAIELFYLLAPNVPLAHRLTIPGAVIAASAWLALSAGLGFYFHHFGESKLDAVYGILAAPVALVIWLYWGAAAILIGAEINVNLQYRKSLSMPESAKRSQIGREAA
jgi:membrane protein